MVFYLRILFAARGSWRGQCRCLQKQHVSEFYEKKLTLEVSQKVLNDIFLNFKDKPIELEFPVAEWQIFIFNNDFYALACLNNGLQTLVHVTLKRNLKTYILTDNVFFRKFNSFFFCDENAEGLLRIYQEYTRGVLTIVRWLMCQLT